MSLLNLRIRGRLFGGFGALILSGIGLAGFGVMQLDEIHAQVKVMTLQSANTLRAGEIATELQAIRRAILHYSAEHDDASATEADKRLAKASEMVASVIKTTVAEERRAIYRQIATDIEDLQMKQLALGDAVKQMDAGRAKLLANGSKMAADLQKFVDTADGTPFEHQVAKLDQKIYPVFVANWRFLAIRDAKNLDAFKTNLVKAREEIAVLDKAELPAELAALLASVKTSLGVYAEASETSTANMQLGDELYTKGVTPLTLSAIDKIDKVRVSIGQAFEKTIADTNERIASTTTLQEIVAGGATLLGLAIAFLIARGITRPLSGLTSGMQELADGNFGVVLPGTERKDEVGEMARAVETFKIKAEQKARDEAEAKVEQDLAAARQRKAEMHKLADQFEGAVGEIIETVTSASTELEASAHTLTSTANRAQELTTMVAGASEEASANVQSVASATEEMASSVTEISRQVQDSATIAQQAVEQARTTNARIGELAKAASRIGDVVDLINTIAGQTNLLALNATIEAARAGEAGRGFAVVASEVKALADQTAKATGEISQQIAGMQTATDESVEAIRQIGATIGRMSEIASTIASAVEEQGAATQEISRNVQQAAQGTMQVSSNIVDVQRGAGETGSASSQVLSAAQSLSSESTRLKSEVHKFLDTVRAA